MEHIRCIVQQLEIPAVDGLHETALDSGDKRYYAEFRSNRKLISRAGSVNIAWLNSRRECSVG